MKKTIGIVLALVLATSAFAEFSVNHNATLIPEKASTLSAGVTGVGFSTWNLEYTQGLKKTNLHVKASYGWRTARIQGLLRHCILEWNGIDMGFGYGGEFEFCKVFSWELSPLASWNMSYNFTENIDFYGGVIGGFTFGYDLRQSWDGTAWVDNGAYAQVPLGLYYGTQIDIASNLELYIELQTGLFNYSGNAFIGVNYYLSKGLQIEKATNK
jgi:hypothetical protein